MIILFCRTKTFKLAAQSNVTPEQLTVTSVVVFVWEVLPPLSFGSLKKLPYFTPRLAYLCASYLDP